LAGHIGGVDNGVDDLVHFICPRASFECGCDPNRIFRTTYRFVHLRFSDKMGAARFWLRSEGSADPQCNPMVMADYTGEYEKFSSKKMGRLIPHIVLLFGSLLLFFYWILEARWLGLTFGRSLIVFYGGLTLVLLALVIYSIAFFGRLRARRGRRVPSR
jgi:hypothetical protein